MDPQETWRLLLEAHAEQRLDDAAEHAEHLLAWLSIDGFAPRVVSELSAESPLHGIMATAVCDALIAQVDYALVDES